MPPRAMGVRVSVRDSVCRRVSAQDYFECNVWVRSVKCGLKLLFKKTSSQTADSSARERVIEL